MSRPHEEWLLARMTGEPLRPEVVSGRVFSSLEEAEWAVLQALAYVWEGADFLTAEDRCGIFRENTLRLLDVA